MKEMWNDRYRSATYAYGTEPNTFVKEYIDTNRPGLILFAADGEGRNSVYAAKKGWDVYAVDFSEQAQIKALQLAKQHNISFNYEVANLATWETSQQFNSIVLCYAHQPVSFRKTIHQKMVKYLKPKGTIVLEGFGKEQIRYNSGGPKNIEFLYDETMLRNDFSELNINYLETMNVELSAGDFHKGTANIVRMIAQKR